MQPLQAVLDALPHLATVEGTPALCVRSDCGVYGEAFEGWLVKTLQTLRVVGSVLGKTVGWGIDFVDAQFPGCCKHERDMLFWTGL
jgi:hypothetical protein